MRWTPHERLRQTIPGARRSPPVWREAADREQNKYGIDPRFISSAMEGTAFHQTPRKRWLDISLVGIATALFLWTATRAHWPAISLEWPAVYALLAIGLILLVAAAISLWKLTRFN